MSDPTISQTIYRQLGENRFTVMTGCNSYSYDDNTLYMKLPRNGSKANRLAIRYNYGTDLYTMTFTRYTSPRIDYKRGKFYDAKTTTIREIEDVYCDQLEALFTHVTGLYTRL